MPQRFSSLSLALSIAIPAIAFGSPMSTLAAKPTPQQILNEAVLSAASALPLRIDADATVKFTVKAKTKDGASGSGELHATMRNRTLSASMTEGQVSLDRYLSQGNPDVAPFSALTEPLALQWKKIAANSYIRISGIPTSMTDPLQQIGLDISPALNRWVLLDTNTTSPSLLPSADMFNGFEQGQNLLQKQLKSVSNVPLFRVQRVERRDTTPQGQRLVRLRVIINPAFIAASKKIDIAQLTSKGKDRTDDLREIQKEYAAMQAAAHATHIVAIVDEQTRTLQRIELGGKNVQPKKECTYTSSSHREVCKTTSVMTYTYAIGITFTKDSGEAIEQPTDALPFSKIMELIIPPAPTSTDLLPEEITTDETSNT